MIGRTLSWVLLAGLVLAGGACRPVQATRAADAVAPSSVEWPWREGATRTGAYRVAWRPLPDPIPVNEPFRLELRLRAAADADQALLEDVEVFVHAWMPDHRHGMLRQPRAVPRDDGAWDVGGLLFHMRGAWVLHVDLVVEGQLDRASFEVTLP